MAGLPNPTNMANMSHFHSGIMTEDNSDETATSTQPGGRQNVRSPACDHCREKKIRCDRTKPVCVNCQTARSVCTYSHPQKRPSDVSRNIHRFEEVNSRLERIEESIAALTSAFRESATQSANCACKTQPPSRASSVPTEHSMPSPSPQAIERMRSVHFPGRSVGGQPFQEMTLQPQGEDGTDILYLGASSILTMSNEAQMLAEEKVHAHAHNLAIRDKPIQIQGRQQKQVMEAMGSLHKLNRISSNMAGFIPQFEHRSMRDSAAKVEFNIPTKAEAEELVKEYFVSVQYWFPIFEETSFRADMDKMYLNPTSMTSNGSWVVCFNMVLLFGLYGKHINLTPAARKILTHETHHQTMTSFYNAWSALDDLEVFMTPAIRNIQALVTMAITSIEISRPALCWSLLSQAARSAQSLGLHRAHTHAHLPPRLQRERINLFWLIYTWSNCMALTFGRSSALPDYDIDVPLPTNPPLNPNPHHENFLALIALAQIQGRIYKDLYSATSAPGAHTIAALAHSLAEWKATHLTHLPLPTTPLAVFNHLQTHFGYHNSLNLLHRHTPPGIAAARDSIHLILTAISTHPALAETGVLLWLFSCYPFSAFFTLFRAVILDPSAAETTGDLALMRGLERYFEQCAHVREGAARLGGVARAFCGFAEGFVEVWGGRGKGKRGREEQQPADGREESGNHQQQWSSQPEGAPGMAEAQFLRWPLQMEGLDQTGDVGQGMPPMQYGQGGQMEMVDFESLMAEPGAFQNRLEMAGGQLSFDWFAWEAGFAPDQQ